MARNRKVVLRADGGPDTGMGHFVRTLALGEMLQDDFYCIFATKSPNDQQKKEIYQICDEVIELPDNISHLNTFLKHLKGDEIIVLDNYYFDTEYQKKIKDIGNKLVCIDDIHDKHYVADIVINHAEGLNPKQFSVKNSTKLCLGYKYALLRKPFYENKKNVSKQFDVMINIGGADSHDLTYKIVNNIIETESNYKIAVLTGNAYKGKVTELNKSQLKIFKGLSAIDVSNLMNQSKVGIFPASTIAIEATAMRLPFLVGCFVDNQINIFQGIIKNNLGLDLEDYNNFKGEKLIGKIHKLNYDIDLRNTIINNQRLLLDKKSPERLIKIFNSLN